MHADLQLKGKKKECQNSDIVVLLSFSYLLKKGSEIYTWVCTYAHTHTHTGTLSLVSLTLIIYGSLCNIYRAQEFISSQYLDSIEKDIMTEAKGQNGKT